MDKFLIKNTVLMDASQKTYLCRDILIENGIISAIGDEIQHPDAHILDIQGKYVSTGWIDAHAHLYTQLDGPIGIDQDMMIDHGVTFAVDAGTAGPGNFQALYESCEKKALPSAYYLNLAPMGVDARYGELKDLSKVDIAACKDIISRYDKQILGVKLRIDPRVCSDPFAAMRMIRKLADDTGKPLIVHASRTDMSIADVLIWLKKGDVFAHTFADKTPGLLDKRGIVKNSAWDAKARGVYFDVSHGKANFSFDVARKAIMQGFLPDAISTDLHKGSLNTVHSLPITMSKMMACGLDLQHTVDLVTSRAASMLNLPEYSGRIQVGDKANLTFFEVLSGKFTFTDSDGNLMPACHKIIPYAVFLNGIFHLCQKSLS